jgi:hypothetical protein
VPYELLPKTLDEVIRVMYLQSSRVRTH